MKYKFQVNFEIVFVSGQLSGRRYAGAYEKFADRASADRFAEWSDGKVKFNAVGGLGEYVREFPIISELE